MLPGDTVLIKGKRILWRRMKLRSQVQMFLESGDLVAEGTVTGIGVKSGN